MCNHPNSVLFFHALACLLVCSCSSFCSRAQTLVSDCSTMDTKHSEAEQLRRVAFVGVVLSTVATLSAVLTVPALYNHMQYVHAELEREVDYCKVCMNTVHMYTYCTVTLGHNASRTWPDTSYHRTHAYGPSSTVRESIKWLWSAAGGTRHHR
jgi:hypothetical protein